jgi:tetratricopeptide (TPR) repeat protein
MGMLAAPDAADCKNATAMSVSSWPWGRLATAGLGAGLTLWLLGGSPAAAHPEILAEIEGVTRRIEADPASAELYLKRGELYRIDGDWTAAAADYERARQLDPQLHPVEFCTGKMRLEAGDARAALAHLNRFLAVRGDDAEGLALRGRVHVALGEGLAAATDFGRAIERRVAENEAPPPELYIARSRALLQAGAGHADEALSGLAQGLELLARPITLEQEALDVELGAGRTDAALARVERLLATSTLRPEPWLVRRAEILEQAGRPADARRAWRTALDALEAQPALRRTKGFLAALERQARAGLERIPAGPDPAGAEGGR